MDLQKLWVSQNLVEFHGSRSLVLWSVMCVSQCRFLYEGVSESQNTLNSRSRNLKSQCLGLAQKNASLAVSHLPFATTIFILWILVFFSFFLIFSSYGLPWVPEGFFPLPWSIRYRATSRRKKTLWSRRLRISLPWFGIMNTVADWFSWSVPVLSEWLRSNTHFHWLNADSATKTGF